LQDELGLAYLFIAHGLNVIKHVSDRIGVMYLGQIMELSTRDDLFKAAYHPYTQALLSAIPIPDPTRERTQILLEGSVPSPIDPPPGCVFQNRCRYCTEVCKQSRPPLTEVSLGHFVACVRVQTNEIGKVSAV
jgi:oligopeptide/dipeptide ABC transporter ATP-binding protein